MVHLLLTMGWSSHDLRPGREEGPVDVPVLASLVSNEFVEISDDSLRPAPVNPLSEQEHRVLRRFADGKSPVDIARELEISAQTLRNHLRHINQKLGTHNRLEARHARDPPETGLDRCRPPISVRA
jgi:DNA-binding CsgD family transcriptional regulator